MGSVEGAFRPPLSAHFPSIEGYPSALPHVESGTSSHALRPLAPIPLQAHQHNYYGGDPSYVSAGVPITPALTNDALAADSTPVPLSADAFGTFQPGPNYLFDNGARTAQHGSLQRHASLSGPSHGYQNWSAAYTPAQGQGRPLLTRSNTLTSYSPMTSASISQVPAGDFRPMPLPSEIPTSQFSSAITDDAASLTSTQIAAFEGQAFPSDHPFYSEATPHIDRTRLEMTSNGESALSIPYQRLSNSVMVIH